MKQELGCKDVSRLISEGYEKTLPRDEALRLRLHFVICDTCRNVREQFDFLRSAMRRLAHRDGDQDPDAD